MSLDAIHADGIEEGLQRWAANPGPAPEQSFRVTSFFGAGLKGFPSAGFEVGGSVSDVLSAFGTAAAASGGSAGGMFSLPTPEEQKQEEEARQRMLSGNVDLGAGTALRRKANEFAPDPLTSHQADQVMHGLVRFGAKAVADVSLFGPFMGATVLGLEEGNTVTQNLRAEGVDTGTAAKVGAVQGAISAAGAVMPVAGRTVMQTLGLVGVGGPGSYMAQEALSKKILEQAGYQDQASLHNPFDPLGLALSTIIPGGFGAFHLRGEFKRGKAVEAGTVPIQQLRPEELRALKYDDPRLDAYAAQSAEAHGVPPALLLAIKNAGEKSGPTAVSPKGAQGVMQFMPGTAKEMGLADRTDPIASIDAGARYLKKLYDAYGSWDAAVAHYNGGGAQAAIVRGGGRPTAKETIGYLDRVQKYVAEHTASEAAGKPEAVDAARVAALNDTVQRSLPDTPDAVEKVQRAADVVAESGGRAAEAVVPEPPGMQLFHGTKDDTVTVDTLTRTQDIGPHFTTSRETAELFANSEGTPGRVLEARGRFTRPLELPDLDGWFPTRMAEAIDNAHGIKAGEDGQTPLQARVWAEMERVKNEYLDAQPAAYQELRNRFGDLSAERQALKKQVGNEASQLANEAGYQMLRQHLAEHGYDSIKYINRSEGAPVDTYIALDRSKVRDANAPDGEATQLREADNSLPDPASVKLAGDEQAKAGAELGSKEPGTGSTENAGKSAPAKEKSAAAPDSGSAAAPQSLDTTLAQKLATEQPDLQVILPGTDTPISVKDAMARIAEEQKQDVQWAELVRTAAECALTAA